MTEPIPVVIPRDTVNDDSAMVLAWKTASGMPVEKDQLICEVETSKVVLEIHAPESGVLMYTAAEGDEIPVGTTICTILPDRDVTPVEPVVVRNNDRESPVSGHSIPPTGHPAPARLSAAARATAAELGVDGSSFLPGSLVRRNDVLRKARKLSDIPDVAAEDRPIGGEFAARGVLVRWEDLPRRKLIEGRTLQRGRRLAVQSSVTSICRTTLLPARLKEAGLSVAGLQSVIIFEAARLMHKYPMFNAVYDRGRIGLYGCVNVGWAHDSGQGLVVPVIPDADRKTVQEISSAIHTQLEAYLENRLAAADLLGATFTVTDLSSSGASFFDPLIPSGQSAILGIGIGPEHDGQGLLYLTLAFDHQLTEGKKAAEFLQDLRARLETQASLASGAAQRQDSEEAMPFCVLCHRDSLTLQRSRLVLLKSEIPRGFVCSLCVAGW